MRVLPRVIYAYYSESLVNRNKYVIRIEFNSSAPLFPAEYQIPPRALRLLGNYAKYRLTKSKENRDSCEIRRFSYGLVIKCKQKIVSNGICISYPTFPPASSNAEVIA